MKGKIHPPKTMFLRVHVGEAETPGKEKYEMSLSTNSAPIILSKATGKWFALSWSDIVDLAREAGIDDPY